MYLQPCSWAYRRFDLAESVPLTVVGDHATVHGQVLVEIVLGVVRLSPVLQIRQTSEDERSTAHRSSE